MPVSSVEISQLIAGQQQNIINSYRYAQNISAVQNPYSGLESQAQGVPGTTGAMTVTSAAPALAQGMGQAASMGMGALGLAAGFGYAPRMFDPFSQVWHTASAARATGGMAGAIGAGAMTAGAYLAVGKAAEFVTGNIMQGVQQRAHMVNTVLGNAPQAGMQMNVGLETAGGMANAALGISDAAYQQGLGANINPASMANLVGMGMQSGQFKGVQSVNQFRAKLQKLTAEATQMASLMKTSIEEASGMISQLQGLGISSAQAPGFMQNMGIMSTMTGMGVGQQLGLASTGAQTFRAMGLSGAAGANYQLNFGQTIGRMQMTGGLSEDYLRDIGGVNSATSRFTNAAVQIFSGRRGMRLLGAMMDEDGNLDTQMAFKVATGNISRKEIMTQYKKRATGSARDTFLTSRQDIMGQFMEQYGAAGAVHGLETMMTGGSGKKTPEFMTQALSGLSGRDLSALREIGQSGETMKLQMRIAAQAGLAEGAGGARSFGEIISKAVDRVTGPIKQTFRKLGRDIQEGLAGTLDDISRDLSGQGPRMRQSGGTGHHISGLFAMGHGEGVRLNMGGSSGALGMAMSAMQQDSGFGMGEPITAVGSMVRGLMPRAIYTLGQGGDLSDLRGYGLFTDPDSAYGIGGLALAGENIAGRRFASRAASASMSSSLGKLGVISGNSPAMLYARVEAAEQAAAANRGFISRAGDKLVRGGQELSARISSRFGGVGMSGRGTVAGLGKLASGGMRGAGYAMKGLGALARGVGGPGMWLYEAANFGSWAAEAGGIIQGEGDIQGREARDIAALSAAGILKTTQIDPNEIGAISRFTGERYKSVQGLGTGPTNMFVGGLKEWGRFLGISGDPGVTRTYVSDEGRARAIKAMRGSSLGGIFGEGANIRDIQRELRSAWGSRDRGYAASFLQGEMATGADLTKEESTADAAREQLLQMQNVLGKLGGSGETERQRQYIILRDKIKRGEAGGDVATLAATMTGGDDVISRAAGRELDRRAARGITKENYDKVMGAAGKDYLVQGAAQLRKKAQAQLLEERIKGGGLLPWGIGMDATPEEAEKTLRTLRQGKKEWYTQSTLGGRRSKYDFKWVHDEVSRSAGKLHTQLFGKGVQAYKTDEMLGGHADLIRKDIEGMGGKERYDFLESLRQGGESSKRARERLMGRIGGSITDDDERRRVEEVIMGSDDVGLERMVGAAVELDITKDTADRIDKARKQFEQINKYGGVKQIQRVLTRTGIAGSGAMGEDIADYFSFIANADASDKEQAMNYYQNREDRFNKIAQNLYSMDTDDLAEMQKTFDQMGRDTNNPLAWQLKGAVDNQLHFRRKLGDSMKKPAKDRSRLKTLSAFFGGGKEVEGLLGMRKTKRGKEYQEFTKASIVGGDPVLMSTRQRLTEIRARQMAISMGSVQGGVVDIASYMDEAGKDVQRAFEIVGSEGGMDTKEERDEMSRMAGAIDMAALDRGKGMAAGAAGGPGGTGMGKQTQLFVESLEKAGDALVDFKAKINGDAN